MIRSDIELNVLFIIVLCVLSVVYDKGFPQAGTADHLIVIFVKFAPYFVVISIFLRDWISESLAFSSINY